METFANHIRPANVNPEVANEEAFFIDKTGKTARLDMGLSALQKKYRSKLFPFSQALDVLVRQEEEDLMSYAKEPEKLSVADLLRASTRLKQLLRYEFHFDSYVCHI